MTEGRVVMARGGGLRNRNRRSLHLASGQAIYKLEGEACGAPRLAKNERDVGHPAIVAEIEPSGGGSEAKGELLAVLLLR
jgi:hypothetical protein